MLKYLVIFPLLFLASTGFSYEAGRKYQITFYHVNDTHGAFYKSPVTQQGGFAILSTMVKKARAEAARVDSSFFLTSGGDVNTGTPESDLLLGEPDFRAMKALGFDAMVVGNHEFDRSWKQLSVQHEWAQFPFLAANIRASRPDDLPLLPYVIKEKNGLKIAFLGLTTEHSRFLTVPTNTQGLEFDPAIETAKKWVPVLRKNADVVVVLSHLGWCAKGGCQAPNDVLLARAVPGIDLILGGHSHSAMEKPDVENGVLIFQAAEKNQHVGVLQLQFLNGKVSLKRAELKPIAGKEDPALLKILDPLKKSSTEKLKAVIGKTPVFLDGERENIRVTETNLGNLLALSFKDHTNSDMAIINGGGVRGSIRAGDITYGDVHNVLPFGNTVCTVELNGQEMLSYMEKIAAMVPGDGNFPQMSGVSLKTDRQNRILEFKINNQPVQPERRYKVAMNNFMAEGGDFYPNVRNSSTFVDTGLPMDFVLRSFIEKKKVIAPQDIKVTGYYQRAVIR